MYVGQFLDVIIIIVDDAKKRRKSYNQLPTAD
jgi:hypothetical protein